MVNSSSLCQIQMRNTSGVPVIDVSGVVDKASLQSLEHTIDALIQAGHYNIVLNMKRALAMNLDLLHSLAKCVGVIRAHYGNIDLVVEAQHIAQAANKGLAQMFRLSASETQAFGRIKRLLRPPDDLSAATPARILE